MNAFEATRTGFGFEKPNTGETNDWLTPLDLVNLLGEFDLDPCGCPVAPYRVAKETYLLPDQDGLALPWHGMVFCNPPYGPEVGKWADKMASHRNGIFLIFSRVETKAWERIWSSGDAFLFPFGRIKFNRPNGEPSGSGTAPSALIAYGGEAVSRLYNSDIAGARVGKATIRGSMRVSGL